MHLSEIALWCPDIFDAVQCFCYWGTPINFKRSALV